MKLPGAMPSARGTDPTGPVLGGGPLAPRWPVSCGVGQITGVSMSRGLVPGPWVTCWAQSCA